MSKAKELIAMTMAIGGVMLPPGIPFRPHARTTVNGEYIVPRPIRKPKWHPLFIALEAARVRSRLRKQASGRKKCRNPHRGRK